MPNNYDFLDANSSILTARSSITSGSAHEPYVIISSMPAVVTTPSGNQSVSGTVNIGNNASVSGTVGASIIGMIPTGTNVIGSVVTLQGTNPWRTLGSVSGTVDIGISSGSVLSQQMGTVISSVVNSIPSSLLTGIHGHRNDAIASYLGADLSWRPIATDSAGRILTTIAPEEARIEGYVALTSTSVTTLVAAAGAGLKNYITDVFIANTGAAATLVTFISGGGASILGYTIAPAGSGSNLPGITTPIRTLANQTFDVQAGSNTSTLYATVKGFKAP